MLTTCSSSHSTRLSLMAAFLQLLLFSFFLSWPLIGCTSPSQIPQQYVVYMGSSSVKENIGGRVTDEFTEPAYLQLLSSIIPSEERERISLIDHYHHAFKGFSALLTQDEASVLSGHEDVVSVFKDPILQLHTTRSWDFLEAVSGISRTRSGRHGYPRAQTDVIIGVIDTGIWPESPSFSDKGIGEIPPRWKGECMEGSDFKKFNCNRKLIGARYYGVTRRTYKDNRTRSAKRLVGSPRDGVGHGTHTASIAAGTPVANVSYYGLARGIARGGSPSARIAVYKACTLDGCSGATILKAMDDAIKDGVDIISISIGMSSLFQSDYLNDPIAIGAFHAQQMGVMVVCSGGNDGPDTYTVVNTAPWIFTVAASNIDRDFQSAVVLGNGRTLHGSAINFSNLTQSTTYPLVFGKDVAGNFTPIPEAESCYPGSLDRGKVAGKIVVCVDNYVNIPRQVKRLVAEDAGAKGLILIDEKGAPFDSGVFPSAEVGINGGTQILRYMNSTMKPTATILAATDVFPYKPAPTVAYFSSSGPGGLTENILKPDIMAPGVAILAAVIPKSVPGSTPPGKKPSGYAIRSGTSMACPHVTGAAAMIKSLHNDWSPSMIKSALMTTATISNNVGKPLTNSSHFMANPHEMGVGEISPLKALDPGLVFETKTEDYLQFLCYFGYSEKNIRSMANKNFNCPRLSYDKFISDTNYPSISVSKLNRTQLVQHVKRTVTNVGSPNSTYTANVQAPEGLVVKVSPRKMVFTEGLTQMSFKVSFYGKKAANGYNFGHITWVDGRHSVRLVFAVNIQ